jgi:hypothetical protein
MKINEKNLSLNTNQIKAILVSTLATIVSAIIGLLIILALSTSVTNTDGIGTYTGGISESNLIVLVLSLPVIFFIIFFISRRAFK